jgi:hypothetical protein
LHGKQHAADEDTGPPTISLTDTVVDSQDNPPEMSNRYGAVNKDTTTNVGAGVTFGDNSHFAIDGTTTNERVDTGNISNVKDGVDIMTMTVTSLTLLKMARRMTRF